MFELDVRPTAAPRRRPWRLALAAVLALGALASCSDDDGADVRSSGPGADSGSGSGSGSASGTGSGSGSEAAAECEVIDGTDGVADADARVEVALREFSVTVDPEEADAGAIGFVTANEGAEPHELVIARTTPDEITVVDGAPDEAALGDALIGELEAFPAGDTCEGTFELTAGDYTLFCAIVEEEADGTVVSHYEEGMVATFSVG